MRFMDQYVQVKRVAESAEFGGLVSATVATGNFGMAMNGTHYFEMFRYLTDEPAVEVTAWFDDLVVPNPRGPQFEDRAGSVRLTTESGKRFYLDAGADQGHGLRALYAGRNGQIFVDELAGRAELVVRRAEHRDLPTTRYGMPFEESSIPIRPADAVAPTSAVLSALRAGENYPSGEDGRLAVATLVAAYLSNEDDHRAVRLDCNLPRERMFPWA
jgi:predicted dehydrogenase